MKTTFNLKKKHILTILACNTSHTYLSTY